MKRPVLTLALIVLATIAHPTPAAAGFWAWLEEWSGPGPFKGWTFLTTACVQEKSVKPSPIAMDDQYHESQRKLAKTLFAKQQGTSLNETDFLKRLLDNPTLSELVNIEAAAEAAEKDPAGAVKDPAAARFREQFKLDKQTLARLYANDGLKEGPGHSDKHLVCGYFDYGYFHAVAGRGYPTVNANIVDVGPSARLHDGVDIGGGIGRVWFTSKPGAGPDQNASQWTLTPLRVVLRPILLGVPEQHRRKWMGFLNLYWKEIYVSGKLTGETFAAPKDQLDVNGELVRSFGFNLDVTAFLPKNWLAR